MISEGQIKAKIDAKQQMISFIDDQKNTSGGGDQLANAEYLEVVEELERQNKKII